MAYENAPKVHSDEQTQVKHTVEWEKEYIYVVGNRLEIAVNGMKRMRCKRRRDWGQQFSLIQGQTGRLTDPFVMGLVEDFIEYWEMKPAMNPVNTIVRKQEEAKLRWVDSKR